VVGEVKERLSICKRGTQKFDMEGFRLKNLNEVKGKEEYQVKIPNRFAALENLDSEEDINRDWETIRISVKETIKSLRNEAA
jgi:hypothetical protein